MSLNMLKLTSASDANARRLNPRSCRKPRSAAPKPEAAAAGFFLPRAAAGRFGRTEDETRFGMAIPL
jgi:hypothetical protein